MLTSNGNTTTSGAALSHLSVDEGSSVKLPIIGREQRSKSSDEELSRVEISNLESRYQKLREIPLDFRWSREFNDPDASNTILGPLPVDARSLKKTKAPKEADPYLASLYNVTLLSKEQEQHLFRRYNFQKYCAAELLGQVNAANISKEVVAKIEGLVAGASEDRNRIFEANLRLVISVARKFAGKSLDFFELVSDGNLSLVRAIEGFDYTRGFKFSTYATWAITKNFYRSIPDELKKRERLSNSDPELLNQQIDRSETSESLKEREVAEVKAAVGRLIAQATDPREADILRLRFGLGDSAEPMTLKEVGIRLGVTKERIRQIEGRALGKLKAMAYREPSISEEITGNSSLHSRDSMRDFVLGFQSNPLFRTLAEIYSLNKNRFCTVGEIKTQLEKYFDRAEIPAPTAPWLGTLVRVGFLTTKSSQFDLPTFAVSQRFCLALAAESQINPTLRTQFGGLVKDSNFALGL